MGEYSKALSSYERSLEIQKVALPPNHPGLATSYNNIGSVYYNMGEYSKALSYLQKAHDIYEQALPPTHPDRINSKKWLEQVKNKL
jgi:tetratricopeptide (TPR) repeat protein